MSEQPEATKPAERKLCKMGCGFFGSNATGDCCSKCWASIKPKDDTTNTKKKESSGDESDKSRAKVVAESTEKSQNESTAELAVSSTSNSAITDVTATADPPSPAKKKKKKASYRNMMAGMLEGNAASRDVEKEKEKLKEVTGGGHFQKIDKI